MDVINCKGKLVCKVDYLSGFLETKYKGFYTRMLMPIGGTFFVELDNIITEVVRDSSTSFDAYSYPKEGWV